MPGCEVQNIIFSVRGDKIEYSVDAGDEISVKHTTNLSVTIDKVDLISSSIKLSSAVHFNRAIPNADLVSQITNGRGACDALNFALHIT